MKKFLKKMSIAMLATTTIFGGTAALVHSGVLPTITVPIQGGTTATVRPSIDLSWDGLALAISISGTADLSQLQKDINGIAAKFNHASRCDLASDVSNVKIVPNGQMAKISLDGHVQQNWCTYATLPEWEGLWTVRMVTRVRAEGMYFSQSGHIELDCKPTTDGKSVGGECKVVTADMSGLLGKLKLAGTLKSKFTDAINKAISSDKMGLMIPKEYQAYDIKIKQLTFADLGDGKLGLNFTLNGKVTGKQFWSFFRNYVHEKLTS